MFFVFCLATIIVGGYVIVSKRRFDPFTIAYLSVLLYFIPAFFGFTVFDYLAAGTLARTNTDSLEDNVYPVLVLIILGIGIGAFIHDRLQRLTPDGVQLTQLPRSWVPDCTMAYLAVAAFSLPGVLADLGSDLFNPTKADVLEASGRWMVFFECGAALGTVSAFAHRRRIALLVGFLLLLFHVAIGFRNVFVMSVLAVATIHLARQGPLRLIARWKEGAALAALLFSVLVVKQLLWSIRFGFDSGDFMLFFDLLTDSQTYWSALLVSEPFATFAILNEVVRTEFAIPLTDLLHAIIVAVLPLSGEFGFDTIGFNERFQPVLFPGVGFGMAGNIWAQMYALGGFLGVALFVALFCSVLALLSRLLVKARPGMQAFWALHIAYWAFYINRNDLLFQLLTHRRILVVFIIALIFATLLPKLRGITR